MAMFTTYIAWPLTTHHGFSYWPAFFQRRSGSLSSAASRFSARHPAARACERADGGDGDDRAARDPERPRRVDLVAAAEVLPQPVPDQQVGGRRRAQSGKQDTGTFAVTLGCVVVSAFFRFTKLGLGMRAGALNPRAARLLGVRTRWLLALGWGFAAVLGAVSRMMARRPNFLSPSMMQAVLIFAFAGAILGGSQTPVGAVVGGLGLGVLLKSC